MPAIDDGPVRRHRAVDEGVLVGAHEDEGQLQTGGWRRLRVRLLGRLVALNEVGERDALVVGKAPAVGGLAC